MPKRAGFLTKPRLDKLRRDAAADPDFAAYVADAAQPGLYVRARRGRVGFVFDFRPIAGGHRRRLPLDWYGAITLEQARAIAQRHRAKVAEGRDPQEERRREAREGVTVAEAVKAYLADLQKRAEGASKRGKRSGYAEAKRRLERNVVPRLGGRRLKSITVADVRALHRAMEETPVEANRTLQALSAVYGFADLEGMIPAGVNPCRHVERNEETGERRALTTAELEALGAALRDAEAAGTEHPSALLAVRLLALTGFRRGEVLGHSAKKRRGKREGLRWGDVDLEGGLVTLEDSKTGRQVRAIGRAAIELLKAAKPEKAKPSELVCPGKLSGSPFVGIDKTRLRLFKAAKLTGVDLHSLRHTFASIGAHAQNGRFAGLVGPLLGHGYTKRAVTERYISGNPEALRVAADAIAAEIAGRLGLGEDRGRVLKFER